MNNEFYHSTIPFNMNYVVHVCNATFNAQYFELFYEQQDQKSHKRDSVSCITLYHDFHR